MSNFNTLTETSDTQEVDYFLLRQNGVDYKQKRSSMTANKAQSEAGQSTTEFETPAGVNSAMEQFGQFGRNKYITSGSAKDIVKRGGYILSVGVTDKPSSNQEYYLWVDNYNTGSTEVTQKAKATKGSDKTYYTKSKIDGVWESNWTKAWDDINLPRATDTQSLDSNSNVSYVYSPSQLHTISKTYAEDASNLSKGTIPVERLPEYEPDIIPDLSNLIRAPLTVKKAIISDSIDSAFIPMYRQYAVTEGIGYATQLNVGLFKKTYSGWDDSGMYVAIGRTDRHPSNYFLLESRGNLTFNDGNKNVLRTFWSDYNLPIPTEAQAQDHGSTKAFAWTPQRVAQAIDSRSVGEAQVFEAVYPVGSVYTNYSNPANPNTYLKGGGNSSWTKIEGRVVVGVGSVDGTTFNAGSTGGEVNHQLTIAEMPSHNHNILMAQASDSSFIRSRVGNGAPGKKYGTSTTAIENGGGNASHNNMQPYITCYVWRRTA